MLKYALYALLAAVAFGSSVATADDLDTQTIAGHVTTSALIIRPGQPLFVSITLQNASATPQVIRYFPPQIMVQLCVWNVHKHLRKPHDRDEGFSGHLNSYAINLAPSQTWTLRWNDGITNTTSFDTGIWGYHFKNPGKFALSAVYAGLTDRAPFELCPIEQPNDAAIIEVR